MEVWTTLVEVYEEKEHRIAVPDPMEAILYHMGCRGLSRRDLEPYSGSRARIAEMLNRKRPLILDMIRRPQAALGISTDVLLQP